MDLSTLSPTVIGLSIGAAVLIALLVAFVVWKRSKAPKDTVLLVGPAGSGKTVLYHQLRAGKAVDSVTSMAESVANFRPVGSKNDKTYWFVDIPGHERLRARLAARLSGGSVRRIVMVVDSSTVVQRPRDSAEVLFDVLASPSLAAGRVPVLVFCNKADVSAAASMDEVRTSLSHELTRLRKTRAAMADTADAATAGDAAAALGGEGEFKFDNAPLRVTFAAGSALSARGLDAVTAFVQ